MQIEYSYKSVPTIRNFSKSDKFMRGLMGPFGSGKSSGCVIEIIRRGHAQAPGPDGVRRTRWAVIRNTYQQLNDTTIKTFHNWLPSEKFGTYLKQEHRYIINRFPGVEIEVLFRALDRPDQVDNLLSLELTGAWVNEAREVPWSIIDALQGRVGRYPAVKDGGCSWFGVFMDTNPPDEDSPWFKFFEESGADNAAIFKQPSGILNPENLDHLPPEYYTNLAKGKSEDWVKVYVRGEYGFVRDGKAVYPEYNDNIHCKPCEPIRSKPIRRGWDFGLTPSCTFSQLLPSGQWIIFDELVSDSLGVDRFASNFVLPFCAEKYPRFEFQDFGDPAGNQRAQTDEKTCFQILQTKGIEIEAGEVSDTLRIEAVRKPLNTMIAGQPGLLIHPRCKVLRKGFIGGYQYRRMMTSQEKYSDKPDKNQYSHPHDALQYDASRLFGQVLTTKKQEETLPDIDTSYIV